MMETHKALNFSRDFVIQRLSDTYELDLSSNRVVEFYLPGTFEPTKSIYPIGHFDPDKGLLILSGKDGEVSKIRGLLGLKNEPGIPFDLEASLC
jgi:hypothetical protein